jgi:hypothetical protein
MDSPVPLAKCKFCKTRRRVLPVEIFPFKTFGLPVIETICRHYTNTSDGLRNTVKTIPGVAPHFSTLHGWIGAMGERALDRIRYCPPTSALIAETASRKDPELTRYWNKIVPSIASWKYKSQFRKERVISCFKLLYVALLLFQNSPYPLTRWEAFLVPLFHVPCFLFFSRNIITAIQLTEYMDNVIVCEQPQKRGPP